MAVVNSNRLAAFACAGGGSILSRDQLWRTHIEGQARARQSRAAAHKRVRSRRLCAGVSTNQLPEVATGVLVAEAESALVALSAHLHAFRVTPSQVSCLLRAG